MATPQYLWGNTQPVEANVATSKAVAVGDLCAMLAGTLVVAADETWVNDLLTTQENFVSKFLGVSAQRKDANVARVPSMSDDNTIRVDTCGDWEFDCAAATFGMGQMVGPAKDTGNALLSQKVVAVTTINAAIGRVVKQGLSVTRVRVRILSNLCPLARTTY